MFCSLVCQLAGFCKSCRTGHHETWTGRMWCGSGKNPLHFQWFPGNHSWILMKRNQAHLWDWYSGDCWVHTHAPYSHSLLCFQRQNYTIVYMYITLYFYSTNSSILVFIVLAFSRKCTHISYNIIWLKIELLDNTRYKNTSLIFMQFSIFYIYVYSTSTYIWNKWDYSQRTGKLWQLISHSSLQLSATETEEKANLFSLMKRLLPWFKVKHLPIVPVSESCAICHSVQFFESKKRLENVWSHREPQRKESIETSHCSDTWQSFPLVYTTGLTCRSELVMCNAHASYAQQLYLWKEEVQTPRNLQ